jgi:transcriptional regulator
MYTPTLFEEPDIGRLHALIEAHPFGTLLAREQDGIEICHVPFLLDRVPGRYGELRVHVARANPIWRRAERGAELTAIFAGPDGYVSPRWYEHPSQHVPTWNYAVVHAHGHARGVMAREQLLRLLDELTDRFEGGSPAPWSLSQLEAGLRESLPEGIVGLRIPIERLEGKFKLSQNRSAADRVRVLRGLRERGGTADLEMALLMEAPPAAD